MTKAPEEPWDVVDRLLAADRYLRFSLDSMRNWENAWQRQWRAAFYTEGGKVRAKAVAATWLEAVRGAVEGMQT
ncbi:MAG: hypothetical protein ACRDZ4_15960 [Egibacteraceae bacterium]